MSTTQPIRAPKGLENVIVDTTEISGVDPKGEHTIYRGYQIGDLAINATFEEAAFLFLYGHLPKREELEEFSKKLKENREIPKELYELFKLLPRTSHPMDIARIGVSYIGTLDEEAEKLSVDLLYKRAISIVAKMPTIIANGYRISRGLEPITPDLTYPHAKDALRMIIGREPTELESRAFEVTLILYMDHGFNASTFTARVIASTLSDMYAAVSGGLAALKGPLHGGANEKAMKMLLEIGSKEKARSYIEGKLSKKEKIMGFGHRVYKLRDPRVPVAKDFLKKLGEKNLEALKLYEMCDEIEKVMWELKRIPANIDFYTGPLYYVLGIPIELYTPIFAMSRTVGWTAHYIEQVTNNRLIRPKAEYVGPMGLKYVPIEERR